MASPMSAPSAERANSSTATGPPQKSRERTVEQIIDRARSRPVQPPARGAWLLSLAAAVLLWACFTPMDWGPLGLVALVPLALLVRLPQPARWMYRATYVSGLMASLAMLQWMRLGHPMMYLALFAMSLVLAAWFPLFVALSRGAVHRLHVPLTLAVPVVWVALEYARAHVATGFAWYFLGHSQYRWVELIQISDVTGAYGVSFLAAISAACLAGLVPRGVFARLRLVLPEHAADARLMPPRWRQAVAVAVMVSLFAAALLYGYVRRDQADFAAQPGPRIALVQGNFTTEVKHDPGMAERIQQTHYQLTGLAVRHQPDLIVWPETMYRNTLIDVGRDATDAELQEFWTLVTGGRTPRETPEIRAQLVGRNRQIEQQLADWSQQAGAALIIGLDRFAIRGQGIRHYNSAVFITPGAGVAKIYDKVHRVMFGEYVPLRDVLPFLQSFTPFSPAAGIDAGDGVVVFEHRDWNFAPLICFEDTVPHLVRSMVREAGETDVLVNLTNDGWFHGSSELDQHLITAVFRSVECRTPMVRAVNTGISAVIDGDGVIREPDVFIDADHQGRESMRDVSGRFHKQLNAVLVADVPLDNRTSLYVRWGDWFAGGCAVLALGAGVGCAVGSRRKGATRV